MVKLSTLCLNNCEDIKKTISFPLLKLSSNLMFVPSLVYYTSIITIPHSRHPQLRRGDTKEGKKDSNNLPWFLIE